MNSKASYDPVIKYFCDPDTIDLFVTPQVQDVVERIYHATGETVYIGVYPDTAYENWGIPTGLVFISDDKHTFLFPTFLRDPGCGFLVFKIEFYGSKEDNWHHKAGDILDSLVRRDASKLSTYNPFQSQNLNLNSILFNGLESFEKTSGLRDIECFQNASFHVEFEHLSLTEREIQSLRNNFCTISNTVELKGILDVNNAQSLSRYNTSRDGVTGFIHTGSASFENILENRFAYRAAEYCVENRTLPLESIEKGIFGFPFTSELGHAYYQWLKMAMNYALANRYSVFLAIKKAFEDEFSCEVSVLKDTIHCGVVEKRISEDNKIVLFRGVQSIHDNNAGKGGQSLTLLAGHKETISAFVTGAERAEYFHNLISHGTSWNIRNDPGFYNALYSEQERRMFLSLVENAYYNSQPDLDLCIPYTYNFLSSLDFFSKMGLAERVCTLSPLVNIQGEKQRRKPIRSN